MNAPFYYNWGMMQLYWRILYAVFFLVFFVLPSWYVADMRSIIKSLRRKNQLSVDGNWKELENYFESEARPRRPFVWFRRKYLLPGNLETQHAMFLFQQGRLEEALAKSDRAIRQIEGKLWIFQPFCSKTNFKTLCAALRGHTLILGGMGRYNEAREVAAKLERLTGGKGKPNAGLALLEYNCGHLDEALRLAQSAASKKAQSDSMRGVMSFCYTMKGDFEQAIQALSYTPTDIVKLYSPTGLAKLSASPEGAELLEVKRRKLAGVFPPARFLKLARVYIAMEDFEKADHALDEAGKSLGPELGLQMSYWRQRAFSLAGQGKGAEAETYLDRMRTLIKTYPKRSFLWETHYAAGRAYLYLKKFNEAVAELNEAHKVVLHPIEKHGTSYYIAKAHEGTGNQSEAIRYYEIVAADPIPSRLQKEAAEALAARK